jgi:2-haloacid dehalogenase
MPPHPDVAAALKTLSGRGYRLVSLSNSSAIGAATQLENAGLTGLFDKRYSIENIQKYKPHPDTYQIVLDDLGLDPSDVLMVAAHAWDLMGAKNAGLQTAFIVRPAAPLYLLTAKPDYAVNNLSELIA